LAALGLATAIAAAAPFSDLIVFGDSLSDVGNISQATFGIVPGRYYSSGRFSNGPVYVEPLATGLGLGPPVRSTAGGTNFAYGGARTSGTGGFDGLFIRDVDEQVDQFLATRTVDPNALFLVFAGSNDLIGGQSNVDVPVGSLANDLGRLAAAGARNFLVPNLPLLGSTPRFNGSSSTAAQYSLLSTQFNAALSATLDSLQTDDPGLTIFRLDVADLLQQVILDPAAFGFTNVTDAAAPGLAPGDGSYDVGQIAAEPNKYLFWDDLHPTAAVHAMLAQYALAVLVLPGDYNKNGVVDAADFTVWRDTLGQSGAGLPADGTGPSGAPDGMVDQLDYDFWKAHFSEVTGSGLGAGRATAVPEPAAMWLAAIALMMISLRRPAAHTSGLAGQRCISRRASSICSGVWKPIVIASKSSDSWANFMHASRSPASRPSPKIFMPMIALPFARAWRKTGSTSSGLPSIDAPLGLIRARITSTHGEAAAVFSAVSVWQETPTTPIRCFCLASLSTSRYGSRSWSQVGDVQQCNSTMSIRSVASS
jgi:phospholipase/lecithinase/hemolysin